MLDVAGWKTRLISLFRQERLLNLEQHFPLSTRRFLAL